MRKAILLITVLFFMISNLCACATHERTIFNGNKIGDEDHFDLDFKRLNTTYTHDMVLNEGDSIEVAVTKELGEISLLIQSDSGDVAYRGDDVDSGVFEVVVTKPGTYTLSVTGQKAGGQVVFTRKEGGIYR